MFPLWVPLGRRVPAETVSLQASFQAIYLDKSPSFALKEHVKQRRDVFLRRLYTQPIPTADTIANSSQPAPANAPTSQTGPTTNPESQFAQTGAEKDKKQTLPANTLDTRQRPEGANWRGAMSINDASAWISSAPMINLCDALKEKLESKKIITIFLSSPFDGLELERKIFREKYANELLDMCARKGYMLKICDMRFGITSEMSRNHQTISTCMRGIDQADIFLGFFGARYGSSTLIRQDLVSCTVLGVEEKNEQSGKRTAAVVCAMNPVLSEFIAFPASNSKRSLYNRHFLRWTGNKETSVYEINIKNDQKPSSSSAVLPLPASLTQPSTTQPQTNACFTKEYLVLSIAAVDGKDDRVRITIEGECDPDQISAGSSLTLTESTGDWILSDIANAQDAFPFLEEMKEKSVTEMEFEYSFLNHRVAHKTLFTGSVAAEKASLKDTLKNLLAAPFHRSAKIHEGNCQMFALTLSTASADHSSPTQRGSRSAPRLAAGMNIFIEGYPLQTILHSQEKEDSVVVVFAPGLGDVAPKTGTKVAITMPKRVCLSMFRSPAYDAQQCRDRPAEKHKFSVENIVSDKALQSLQARWRTLAAVDNCASFNDYKAPDEGAKCMYLVLKTLLPKFMSASHKNWNAQSQHRDVQMNFLRSRIVPELPLVGREEVLQQIRSAVENWQRDNTSTNALLIHGAPGVGISAVISHTMLSSWSSSSPTANAVNGGSSPQTGPGTRTRTEASMPLHSVPYFVGCHLAAAEVSTLVEYVAEEIMNSKILAFSTDELNFYEGLSTNKKLHWLFELLTKRSHEWEGRILLAIDGLHQLHNDFYDGTSYLAHQLRWLPIEIPACVFLLVSATENEQQRQFPTQSSSISSSNTCVDLLRARDYPRIGLPSLKPAEVKKFVEQTLVFHMKNMDSAWDVLFNIKQCALPAYLSLALDEVITSATFATLNQKIMSIIEHSSMESLSQSIFARLESTLNEIDDAQTNFVGDCLSLLYCARRGLSEAEIVELCNIKFQFADKFPTAVKVNQRHWLMLYFGLHQLLVEYGGFFSFSHPFLRVAVEERYFRQCNGVQREEPEVQELIKALHLRLATYFKMKSEQSSKVTSSSFNRRGNALLDDGEEISREMQEMDYHFNSAGVTPPVRVAVRVRPFLPHETNSSQENGGNDCESIVQMKGKQTIVRNPLTAIPHAFTMDFAFWSCFNDSISAVAVNDINKNKNKKNTVARIASNESIWKLLGATVVQQAIGSFDVSLFAYGQTGSGKTHTMFGSASEPGIIYLTCSELFRQLHANKEQRGINFEVKITMLEIYNETVRDLMPPTHNSETHTDSVENTVFSPPVRQLFEDSEGRVCVKGVTSLPVSSWPEISAAIEAAFKLRAVSGTKMNAQSSRSHCIFTLYLTQTLHGSSSSSLSLSSSCQSASKIHLVDLAGSESGKTREALDPDATKRVLQEGIFINKSLSALNKCIQALADKSQLEQEALNSEEAPTQSSKKSSKKQTMNAKTVHVPYRESKLTHLLKDSLGGNSKLLLLATVSPDKLSYAETLSTLNYAKKAKRIQTVAVKNAEAQFLAEVMKRLEDNIFLVSSDKLKFVVPKAAAKHAPTGSAMLVDVLETNPQLSQGNSHTEVLIPRAVGKVLELVAEFLREHVLLLNASSGEIEEWNAEFTRRAEIALCVNSSPGQAAAENNGLTLLINGLIVSCDMQISDLIAIFQSLVSKHITRFPTLNVELFYRKINGGFSPEQRLDDSQRYIDELKDKKVQLSGKRGYFHQDGELLKAGWTDFTWKCVPVSHGKCAFMSSTGEFITAYGSGSDFQDYIQQVIFDIGMKISSDIVEDLVNTISQKEKDGIEGGGVFNYSCLRVEKGLINAETPTPAINQVFEIHSAESSWVKMVTTFCGTCWRSPDWSTDVMYSNYVVGKARGDEEITIDTMGDYDDNGDGGNNGEMGYDQGGADNNEHGDY